jgi:hypothetical protein
MECLLAKKKVNCHIINSFWLDRTLDQPTSLEFKLKKVNSESPWLLDSLQQAAPWPLDWISSLLDSQRDSDSDSDSDSD